MELKILKKLICLLAFSHLLIAKDLYAYDEDSCFHDENTFRCVEYVRNSDGDTVTFNIPNVHPIIGKEINIRVLGIDTPEIRSANTCEKEKAQYVKTLVSNFLKEATRIDLENIKRGKYFRIVADIKIDAQSLTHYLLKNGLGYPYNGETKPDFDWCRSYASIATENRRIQEGTNELTPQ